MLIFARSTVKREQTDSAHSPSQVKQMSGPRRVLISVRGTVKREQTDGPLRCAAVRPRHGKKGTNGLLSFALTSPLREWSEIAPTRRCEQASFQLSGHANSRAGPYFSAHFYSPNTRARKFSRVLSPALVICLGES